MDAIPRDLRLATGAGIGLFIAFIGLVNARHRRARHPGRRPPVLPGLDWPTRPPRSCVIGCSSRPCLIGRRVPARWSSASSRPRSSRFAFSVDAVARQHLPRPSFDGARFTRTSAARCKLAAAAAAVRRDHGRFLRHARHRDRDRRRGGARSTRTAGSRRPADPAGRFAQRRDRRDARRQQRDELHRVGRGRRRRGADRDCTRSSSACSSCWRSSLAPLAGIVPAAATAPALILVGFLMISQIAKIDFDDLETAIPAFITLLTIPLTYSIAHGSLRSFARWRCATADPAVALVCR